MSLTQHKQVDPSEWVLAQSEEDLMKWLQDIVEIDYVAHFDAMYGKDYSALDWLEDNFITRNKVSQPALQRLGDIAVKLLDVPTERSYPWRASHLLQLIIMLPPSLRGLEPILKLFQSGEVSNDNSNWYGWTLGYVLNASDAFKPHFRDEVRQLAISHLDTEEARWVYGWLARDDYRNAIKYFDQYATAEVKDGVLCDRYVSLIASGFVDLSGKWGPDVTAELLPQFRQRIALMEEPLRQQWKDAFAMGGLPLYGEVVYTDPADQIAWLENQDDAGLRQWIDNLIQHERRLPLVVDVGSRVGEAVFGKIIKQSPRADLKERVVRIAHQLLAEYQEKSLWSPCCDIFLLMKSCGLSKRLDPEQLEKLLAAVQPEDDHKPGVRYLQQLITEHQQRYK